MPPLDLLIAFLLAASIFAYMPGPSTLYAAAQTIAHGRRAGWFAALGLHLGGYVHIFAAAVGLAVLLDAVPALYLAFKLLGAAYLIWLGIRMFLARQATGLIDAPKREKTARRTFWDSVAVEVLNPKTAVFYVAFLPQFADPGAAFALWAQLLILGIVVNVMFSSADILCVVLADRITGLFRASARANTIAQRIGGSILVALGLTLAFDRR